MSLSHSESGSFQNVSIEDFFPPSPMQQGMLFHALQTSASDFYIISMCYRLQGISSTENFEKSWKACIARHSVLRSSFLWEGLDQPLQIVHSSLHTSIDSLDWRNVEPSEQSRRLAEYVAYDRQRGFSLTHAPLFRLTLIRVEQDAYYFIWTYHHILLDGWSNLLLLKEVIANYNALCRGQRRSFATARPYREFIEWLHRQDTEAAGCYWRSAMQGFLSATPLPLDSGYSGAMPSSRRQSCKQQLESGRMADLHRVARNYKLTMNTILQGAWARLLSQYSGENDVVWGTTVSGRPAQLPGVETMVGLFINTLPMRARLEDSASRVVDWLARLQSEQVEAQEYQYVPLTSIQSWSQVRHSEPLFESLIVFENYADDAFETGYGELPQDGSSGLKELGTIEKIHYPLALTANPAKDFHLSLSYDSERFSESSARQICEGLVWILADLAEHPERRFSDWSVITNEMRQQILLDSSPAQYEDIGAKCVHELFEEQAERIPEAIAATFDQQFLSYGELNRRSNRLARYLMRLGVRPEVRVGICLDRSMEMMMALLGVLKAGGAYVPLDPSYSSERLCFMLQDSRARVLVGRIPSGNLRPHDCLVVELDDHAEAIAKEADQNLNRSIMMENLAYVIYTSGSTGRPKGVQIVHSALTNFLRSMLLQPGIDASDILLAVTTLSFDIAGLELYLPLIAGGCVKILTREAAADGTRLLRELDKNVTMMQGTPQTWRLLYETGWSGSSRLKVLCGGEAVPFSLSERLVRQNNSAWNMYGPTETTIWSLARRIGEAEPQVFIGSPIANTSIYVLDELQQLVPPGASGELCIGGAGLARGYMGRPDWTAKKFVPNPFSRNLGQRLYRTGDRVRWHRNGNLEYQGRMDYQVKVRGYRIEPGEIESVLLTHGRLKQAVIITREDQPGDKKLVGYVVKKDAEQKLNPAELKKFLEERLPEYMVPSVLVELEKVPLTANGKVDRKALPRPELNLAMKDEQDRLMTPLQEILAGVWQEVLKVAGVGRASNFFDLGGHSLLAMQVVSRVRELLQVELPLRVLFEAGSTVAGLTEEISRLKSPEKVLRLPSLKRFGDTENIPLSFAQQRLWFLDQLMPGTGVYNISHSVRLAGKLDRTGVQWALSEIVRRHEILRTTVNVESGVAAQSVGEARRIELTVLDLTAGGSEELARRMVMDEGARAFDLGLGPMLRAMLLQLGEDDHVLQVTMHHIASDAWSVGILVREFAEFYEAWREGRNAKLADLSVQYGDYARWQREWLSGSVLEEELGYWKEELRGIVTLDLPTDRVRPTTVSHCGSAQWIEIEEEVATGLRGLARQEGVTLFMLLLACWDVLLARYSGQQDIAVGTVISNRNRMETEGLIGFFVNTLVLRVKLGSEMSVRELLAEVRDVTLGAYEHQDVPFEKLVDELDVERDMSRAPLFQVMMLWQNMAREKISLEGLQLKAWQNRDDVAKFDLTLGMAEKANGLSGWLEYAKDLFEIETMERLAKHYRQVLRSLRAEPQRSVWQIDLLTENERSQLVVEWNETRREYPQDKRIHEWFEEQVERSPETIAIVFGEQHLSYRELNCRANGLAGRLRELGVGPENLVGLYVERSPEMMIGLLGILKAGGAYVPLDTHYSSGRLAYMLQDLRLVVKHKIPIARSSHGSLVKHVDLEEIEVFGDQNLDSLNAVEHIAYVIYTSGSTGRPKPVGVTHRGMCNLATAQQDTFRLGPSSVVMQFSSISFDAAAWEWLMALISGAKLILAEQMNLVSRTGIGELLTREQVTILTIPPSVLASWEVRDFPALRTLIVAGEACPPQLAERWSQGFQMINAYGPTETTVCATVSEPLNTGVSPGIGRPIANMKVYVLDERQELLPVGAAGELYVGGAGLARGYLGHADWTAEKFVPNAFSAAAGERLYRTGDRVRWRGEGKLEYLGRLDQQVKLRGFRIELGEIEVELGRHEAVRQCAVMLREDQPGQRQLVGYVVKKAGRGVSKAELRNYLGERLPEYMVPAVYMELKELPVTVSGKLDRRSLPRPKIRVGAGEQEGSKTGVEEALERIWSQVLKVAGVGKRDNFFELGGDSILSIQVVARAQQAGIKITARQIFQKQTIEELAQVAGVGAAMRAEQGRIRGEVGLTPIQRWLFEHERWPGHFNQSVMLQSSREHSGGKLQEVVRALMEHHDALRLRYRWEEGEWRQSNAEQEENRVFMTVDLGEEEWREGRRRKMVEEVSSRMQESLDLEQGPLVRVVQFRMGGGEERFLLVIHHLAVDGVSWRILLEDLESEYERMERGEAIKLPAKTSSYQQWAEALREVGKSEEIRREREYWKSAGRGGTRLPRDREGENVRETLGVVRVEMSEEQTRGVLQEMPKVYGTQIQEVLLRARGEAIREWMEERGEGEGRVVGDIEGHGRDDLGGRVDVSRTVGWFTAIYPVALTGGGGSLRERLEEMKKRWRGIPGEGVGYGVLRYVEGGEEEMRGRDAEVSFNYLGQLDRVLEPGGGWSGAAESSGATQAGRGKRAYVLEVVGEVVGGRLQSNWYYSRGLHERATIEGVARRFQGVLEELLEQCRSGPQLPAHSLNFALDDMTQEELQAVLDSVDHIDI